MAVNQKEQEAFYEIFEHFIAKNEHGDSPALDYPFASEFYQESCSYYGLVEAYKKLIFDSKQIEVYNCKIEFPLDYYKRRSMDTPQRLKNFYNVYVYVKDAKTKFGDDYNLYKSIGESKKRDFDGLFYQALELYPVDVLLSAEMNTNGVFIEDFTIRAKSYALSKAVNSLETALTRKYKYIQHVIQYDELVYVFFEGCNIKEFMRKNNIPKLKKFAYRFIEPFDIEKVWTSDTLSFRLDYYANYNSLKGNYFNSDAMFKGILV